MSDEWYYRQNGREEGPVSFEELFELANGGTLLRTDSVRMGEAEEWVLAESIVGLISQPELEEPESISSLDELGFEFVSSSTDTSASSQASVPEEQQASVVPDEMWYYRVGDQEFGPLPLEEIVQLAKSGDLGRNDWVRHGSSGGWLRACRTSDFDGCFVAEERASEAIAAPLFDPLEDDEYDLENALEDDAEETSELEDEKIEDDDDVEPVEPQAQPEVVERWFCLIESVEHGPLTYSDLKSMATHHRLSQTDEVKNGDEGVWKRADKVSDLFDEISPEHIPSTPSQPPTAPTKSMLSSIGGMGSGGGGTSLLEKIKDNQKVLLSVLGGGVVLGLIFMLGMMFSGGSAEGYYEELDQIWTEHKALRDRKAPASDWKALTAKAEELNKRIVPKLTSTASRERPELQELLFAARDGLIPMLKECRENVGEREKWFATKMKFARILIDDPSATLPYEPKEKKTGKKKVLQGDS
jgi:hypothetical protein